MQKQKIIFLIIGIVLALVAIYMINVYINQERQAAEEKAKKTLDSMQQSLLVNQTAVLVAKKDIPRGAIIDADLLETKIIPNQYVQPQAVTSLDRVSGMMVTIPIAKGEQITLNKLMWPKEAGEAGSLAMATPAGKRAITISVDSLSSLVGMIKPGDYVDVLAAISIPVQTPEGKQITQTTVMPLFQNVLVLAVGQDIGITSFTKEESRYKKEEKKEISPFITLALAPAEANLLAFMEGQAKIRLILRSPLDTKVQPLQPANWETIFQYFMSQQPQSQLPKEESRVEIKKEETLPAAGYVEVYRGLTKEKVPLYE